MTNSDQLIINQILEGDSSNFAILVDRYKDLVFTLAIRMMKNREEAEEVAQDTFIKAYRKLSNFKGDSKFSTWIYKIAYNTCLDRIKKNRKFLNNIEINEFTVNQVKSIDSALDALEMKERNSIIKECINSLPEEESFLLTLYYFDDLSLDEISKIVRINPNAIKVKIFRSRKKLATLLNKHLEPEIIENYGRKGR